MKIVISDYSGHAFPTQLSRELARRGHHVLHIYFEGFQTPKGKLAHQADDPETFELKGIVLEAPFAKDSFVRRRAQEIEVGKKVAAEIATFAPDLVISGNVPLDTQRYIQARARKLEVPFVYWLQDIYSHAIAEVVTRKMPGLGHAIAAWYRHLEARMLRRSDKIIVIAEHFIEALAPWGIAPEKIKVIENWAPLDELPVQPKDNPWVQANFAPGRLRMVYSGTLGYKHNPHWLPMLARSFPGVDVCVFSEGDVANKLKREAEAEGLSNLLIRPWVDYADLPSMLAGADVFIAFIEPEAGIYSVPSKTLAYLAGGRPILAAMPLANLASSTIIKNNAGFVSGCEDTKAFLANAARLVSDAPLREEQGRNGRTYAECAFDIESIADRFLAAVL